MRCHSGRGLPQSKTLPRKLVVHLPIMATAFLKTLQALTELDSGKLGVGVFASAIIFDRNSQVSFHRPMLIKAKMKTTVHDVAHGLSYMNS